MASSRMGPIYVCSPGHLKFAGVPRSPIHIQEHLQAIQVQIDQILRLSTSFSVSARISSLECESKVLCLVAGSRVNQQVFRCAGPLEHLVARRLVIDPPLCVERRRQPCTGDAETPSPLWASSLVENRIKVTVIVFTEETWLPEAILFVSASTTWM